MRTANKELNHLLGDFPSMGLILMLCPDVEAAHALPLIFAKGLYEPNDRDVDRNVVLPAKTAAYNFDFVNQFIDSHKVTRISLTHKTSDIVIRPPIHLAELEATNGQFAHTVRIDSIAENKLYILPVVFDANKANQVPDESLKYCDLYIKMFPSEYRYVVEAHRNEGENVRAAQLTVSTPIGGKYPTFDIDEVTMLWPVDKIKAFHQFASEHIMNFFKEQTKRNVRFSFCVETEPMYFIIRLDEEAALSPGEVQSGEYDPMQHLTLTTRAAGTIRYDAHLTSEIHHLLDAYKNSFRGGNVTMGLLELFEDQTK